MIVSGAKQSSDNGYWSCNDRYSSLVNGTKKPYFFTFKYCYNICVMIKIPVQIARALSNGMKSPSGSVSVTITFEKSIYEKTEPGGVIFENIAGRHYFRLERTDDVKIKFYHSSPGTGTRLAVTDISKSSPSLKVMFVFTWSPQELKLYVGPKGVTGGKLEQSAEEISDKKLMVTQDEQVIEIGNLNVEIMSVRISKNGKVILDSSAIESWNEALQAVDVLMRATSVDGHIFEVVKSNFIVVNLVTGIETYCKRRLQELESEGIPLDYTNLEEQTGLKKEQIFAETTNHFQKLDTMKKIWTHLLRINIYEINPVAWESFKVELFPHRHVVVHAHSLRSEMNISDKKELLFITNELSRLKNNCEEFIKNLHSETLKLNKK